MIPSELRRSRTQSKLRRLAGVRARRRNPRAQSRELWSAGCPLFPRLFGEGGIPHHRFSPSEAFSPRFLPAVSTSTLPGLVCQPDPPHKQSQISGRQKTEQSSQQRMPHHMNSQDGIRPRTSTLVAIAIYAALKWASWQSGKQPMPTHVRPELQLDGSGQENSPRP